MKEQNNKYDEIWFDMDNVHCTHPEHEPPRHIVVKKPFVHRCPGCGREIVITPPKQHFLMV